jgi:hypothetical protein
LACHYERQSRGKADYRTAGCVNKEAGQELSADYLTEDETMKEWEPLILAVAVVIIVVRAVCDVGGVLGNDWTNCTKKSMPCKRN